MDAESTIKEVKVTLNSDSEAKALTGGKAPRRRSTRRAVRGGGDSTDAAPESGRVADLGGSLSPSAAAVAEGPVARIEKADAPAVPIGTQELVGGEGRGAPLIGGGAASVIAVSPLAEKLSITPPVETKPALSTTSTVGGGGPAAVLIGGKRGDKSTVTTVPIAKILPKRRISAAPAAQTLRKPKFKIGGSAAEAASGADGGKMPEGLPAPQGEGVSGGARGTVGAAKQTRRFKARKIKFTVKSSRTSKEIRHKVKARVRGMSTGDVRKLLLSKGIIKAAAAEKLPEEMLRNMLRDYMLLHNAE